MHRDEITDVKKKEKKKKNVMKYTKRKEATSAHLSICLSRTDAHACVCILRTRHMNEQATGNDLLPRFTNETVCLLRLFCYVSYFF